MSLRIDGIGYGTWDAYGRKDIGGPGDELFRGYGREKRGEQFAQRAPSRVQQRRRDAAVGDVLVEGMGQMGDFLSTIKSAAKDFAVDTGKRAVNKVAGKITGGKKAAPPLEPLDGGAKKLPWKAIGIGAAVLGGLALLFRGGRRRPAAA